MGRLPEVSWIDQLSGGVFALGLTERKSDVGACVVVLPPQASVAKNDPIGSMMIAP